jgi:hypothetical protein
MIADMLTYPFTEDDAKRAFDEWGANCGPTALAVCLGMTLDAIRPHMGDFEAKKYTNPTLMRECVARAGGRIIGTIKDWTEHGLVRIQWHGPWTASGANPRWAYRLTHWVHAKRTGGVNRWVFDVNGGWRSLDSWVRNIVPAIVASIPRADGKWSITHGWEVSA